MNARYDGHLINAAAILNSSTGTWKCVAEVYWTENREGHLKALTCDDREFSTQEDALRVAFEAAVRWINEGKPEPFTWTKDLR